MYSMNPWYPQAQPMTDIGQVSSEQEAVNAYVAAGRSKIMFTADDQMVFVKSVSMNGQTSMDVFVRRTETPQTAASDYVTRDELNEILRGLKGAKKANTEVVSE